MGFKCKFCRTELGNNKYVGFRRVGLCGCGRCNGEFENQKEILEFIRYLNTMKAGYQMWADSAKEDVQRTDDLLNTIKDYREQKYGQDIY